MFSRRRPRRSGFTLVELLTVIGIISLLIGILLPSLSRARAQARRLKVSAQIDAIGKGLEMFRNDFNQYPDSRWGQDGIDWTGADPAIPNNMRLSGAHWLARALAGHDFQGVDSKGLVLQRGPAGLGLTPPLNLEQLRTDSTPPGRYSERKGTYLEAPVFAKDDDITKFPNQMPQGLATGRPVVIDGYGFPVLYYRANPRARYAFSVTGTGSSVPNGSPGDALGVYNLGDNAMITGGDVDDGTKTDSSPGWDFAGTGIKHGISEFGSINPSNIDSTTVPNTHKGKTFTNFLHNESAHETGRTVRPYNPETFILLSAGADGIFGTEDDVSNFKPGDQ